MAKVRCPLCSNLNPPEAETCLVCGARLKPFVPLENQPEESAPEEPAGETRPEDENDWLRALHDDQDGADEPSAGEAEPAADVPDWLSRIRNKAQTETGSAAEEQPDWMQDISKSEAAEPASEEDWFGRLESAADENPAGEPSPAEPAGDLPDWLRDLSGVPEAAFSEAGAQPGASDAAEEDFSWLSGEQQPETTGQPSEDDAGFGLSGFLASIEETPGPEAGEKAAQDESASTEADLPDWLTEQPGAESEAAGVEIPEWLSEAAGDETTAETEPEAAAQDWLAELGGAGEETASRAEPAPENIDLGLAAAAAAEQPEELPEELPDWLISGEPARAEDAVFQPEETATAAIEDGDSAVELPGWMAEFETPVSEQPAVAATPLFADDLPGFGETEETPAAEEGEPALEAPAVEVPDWLRNFDEQTPASASVPPLFGSDTEPEADVSASPEEAAAAGEDQPFAVDLPDWLSEDTPREQGEEAQPVVEGQDEELVEADLPDWVKEMRPIESIIPAEAHISEGDARAEKSGPLAGLAGILPVEDMASRYRRPPVYSAKLRVSEKQRGQAEQFQSIIEQETQPLLIPTRGKRVQGGWLRVLIAMLLIFVLVLPALLEIAPLAVPTLSPDETKRMFDQIDGGLSSSAPVLLAVEFDPALWGEMKLASQPVIDHMMNKNARIVVVSTRANGAAMAEQLLGDTVAGHTGYDLGTMTENLGYLPGDMISLLEFAHQPAFAAPANLAGELAWERSVLQGISTMQDFSMVVVLTDTAETGRAWVEQVQPSMGDVPLLVVASAQAAPMMTPFVESKQVDGMVSGLLGGVLYSQWAQKQGAGLAYLASYQIGLLLALVLALGGGLISGVMALINRGKDED